MCGNIVVCVLCNTRTCFSSHAVRVAYQTHGDCLVIQRGTSPKQIMIFLVPVSQNNARAGEWDYNLLFCSNILKNCFNTLFIIYLLIYIQLLLWDLPDSKIFHFTISLLYREVKNEKKRSDVVAGWTSELSGGEFWAPLKLTEKLSLTVANLKFPSEIF